MKNTGSRDERNRILVIGSSNTDMVVTTDHLPAPGETLLGNSFFMSGGGKGANQAVAAARLGASVSLICKVGDDVFGRQAMNLFAKEGIDISQVLTDPVHPSGVALITVDARGENCIAVAPGANACLLPGDLTEAGRPIAECDIVLMQLEIPLETVAYLSELAFRMGKRVILNPAPACPLSGEILRYISLITPNETEAALISGVSITDGESAREAARKIAGMGIPEVIITRGGKGVLILSGGCFVDIPAFPVEVLDTTAAGDVFNGALALAVAGGLGLSDAARFGAAAAALSVTRKGAQTSAPYLHELDELLGMSCGSEQDGQRNE